MIRLGREEATAHERQLLRRIAATRFDSATAERLMAIGEAIARCATGVELLREITRR